MTTNCVKHDTFLITSPPAISAVFTTEDNICFGDSTGKAFVVPGGGVPPYDLEWKTSQGTTISITDSIVEQVAGTYYLKTKDANLCIMNDTISIGEPAQTLVDICAV